MIELVHVSKSWPSFALCDITLEVRADEYFVLLGPTGAGKTLLLETMAGHHRPDAGLVRLRNEDVTRLPPERRGVGFLYQDCWLFPHMSVARNIAFGLRFARVTRADRRRRVDELVQALGISHLLDRSPVYLSGGERRKVALARALAPWPKILLLDEPLGTLDAGSRERVGRELRHVHATTGMTTLHVTHDSRVARALADRVAIIDQGQIVHVGTAQETIEAPRSRLAAQLLGSQNTFDGVASPTSQGATVVQLGPVSVRTADQIDGPCTIWVDAEHVHLSLGETPSDATANRLEGLVRSIEDLGGAVKVGVAVRDLVFWARMPNVHFLGLGCNVASRVWIAFPPNSVHGLRPSD